MDDNDKDAIVSPSKRRFIRGRLPKGKVKKMLPKGEELELAAPKPKKLLPAPKRRFYDLGILQGTKHYTLEYLLSLKILVLLLLVTYVSLWYLAKRIVTGDVVALWGGDSFMIVAVTVAALSVVLLPALLIRTMRAEQVAPTLADSGLRKSSFDVVFVFAVLGLMGFGLAAFYLFGAALISVGGWSRYGVYAASAAILAGLHSCLAVALPRRPDEDGTRSILEMTVVIPCVAIIVFATGYGLAPARIVRQDKQILKDLVTISKEIDAQYQAKKRLPDSIDEIIGKQSAAFKERAQRQEYKYLALSNRTQNILGKFTPNLFTKDLKQVTAYYSLCAVFTTDVNPEQAAPADAALFDLLQYANDNKLSTGSSHRKGENCFLQLYR